ncbi:MAG: DUF1508 domain-containing protein [Bauldia sp.]|nr:DUF1508 domain-containing protein [Bauldia sp.]
MADSTGYYEIYKGKDGFRWRFKANNHERIASGEAYTNKAGAENAIRLLKGSADAPVKDVEA